MATLSLTGNQCGHNPFQPQYFVVKKSSRPNILQIAQDRAEDFYRLPDKYLPKLRFANGVDSQQRSERREAIASSLQLILHYLDLDTLEAGTPQADGSMLGIQMRFISDKLRFHVKRVYRALQDLAFSKYIKIRWKRLKKFGNYLTIHQLIIFPALFHHLGITQLQLNTSQHYKRKSLTKRAQAKSYEKMTDRQRMTGQTNVAKLQMIVKNAVNAPKPSRAPHTIPSQSTEMHSLNRVNNNGRRMDYFMKLRDEGMSFEAAKIQTDRALPIIA